MLLLAPLFITLGLSNAANVLIYNPMLAQSHTRFLGNIGDIISRAGHNVTVFATEINPLVDPFGTVVQGIHKIFLPLNSDLELSTAMHESINNVWFDQEMKGYDLDEYELFMLTMYKGYKVILRNETLVHSLRNSKFDVAIHEFQDAGSAALMEIFGVDKTILASAIGDLIPYTYEITGIPMITSFVPAWATTSNDKMGLWERIENNKQIYKLQKVAERMEDRVLALFHAYYPKITDVNKILTKKTGLILSNVNEFSQTPRPISSMIQFVGGCNIYPNKPLNKEYEELLNKREHNVIFSLGSFVRLCDAPLHIRKLFAEAFASIPDVTFIVKYENCTNDDFDFNAYGNIVSKTWLPQTDLLADNRVKAFITHGGMNSITEGQFKGKPMITIPIFGDQVLNSKNAVRVGSATMIDRRFITKALLVESLRNLLDPQSSYVKKAEFIKKCLVGREEEYRQKIVKWVELQAETERPFDHLVMHSRNLSVIELYNLDILGFILAVAFIIFVGLALLVRSVYNSLSSYQKKSKTC